eukprot:gene4770-5020_t
MQREEEDDIAKREEPEQKQPRPEQQASQQPAAPALSAAPDAPDAPKTAPQSVRDQSGTHAQLPDVPHSLASEAGKAAGPGLLPGAPAGAAPDASSLAKRKAGRPKAPDPRDDPSIPLKKANRIVANRESADRSKRRQKIAMQEAQRHQEELAAVHAEYSRQIEETEDLVSTVEAPTTSSTSTAPSSAGNVKDIYIGFTKDDTAPREGRKGRVIQDDPSKYPSKEDIGFLPGATGGWAGGEAGLWQLREQVLQEKQQAKKPASSAAGEATSTSSKAVQPQASKDGLAAIYVGYGKDELEKRKAGEPGRFILDNPAKYPAKEDLGIFPGATGGFAGGEKGLKQYIATGDVLLRDPNRPLPRQTSPVAIAGLLIAAGAGGGLLLNEVTDLGESAVKAEIVNAPIDDRTKALLLVAVALLGGVGVLAAGRAAVSSLESRISSAGDQITKLVIAGAFWFAVFFAARAVLEL